MSWVRRRVVEPLLAILKQGTSPEKLGLSIAIGATLGLFPILGSTTLLCFLAGILFRLNHPALQLMNYLVYPLQIPLIPGFVRFGEYLVGAPRVSFSPVVLAERFTSDPSRFMAEFGWSGLHAILAWLAVAPVLAGSLYLLTVPPLRRAARLFERS